MRAGRLAVDALASAAGSRGRVLAVHPRAVNLGLADGDIVALLPSDTPLHPWAVCIPEYEYKATCLTEGTPAIVSKRSLEIGPVSISIDDLHVEELTLTRRPEAAPSAAAIETLERLARNHAPQPDVDAVIAPVLDAFHRDRNTAPLAALVGLGIGLTPSGDDLLVGILAALDFLTASDPTASVHRRELIDALPTPLEAHTPKLSAQMLRAATEGRYPEPLLYLADALALANPGPKDLDRIAAAAQSLLALGHDSGLRFLQGYSSAILSS